MITPASQVMTRAGWAACLAIAGAAVVVAASCWPAMTALFAPNATTTGEDKERQTADERYKASLDTQVASIKGRSLFFIPPRPAPKPIDTPKIDRPAPPPPPPAAPSRYGGPTIQALVTGSVWFSNGDRAAVGETVGSGSSAVTVLAADTPYAVRLKWQDKEWDVAMLDQDGVVFPMKPADKPAEPAPPIVAPEAAKAPPKPAEAKGDEAKPVEAKPGDAKPGDAKPAEAKPGDKPDPKTPEPAAAPKSPDAPGATTPPPPKSNG